jgi:uncharacterized protein YjbI with pentapeptide repeats
VHHGRKTIDGRALGIRAVPDGLYWAIVSGTLESATLEACDTERAPEAYNEGESLVWIRQKATYIIETYKPARVGIRYSEGNARGANKSSAKARCRVEGVILEAAACKNLKIVTGALTTFAKHSGSKFPKEDLAEDSLRGIDWSSYKDVNLREAILVGVSILNLK